MQCLPQISYVKSFLPPICSGSFTFPDTMKNKIFALFFLPSNTAILCTGVQVKWPNIYQTRWFFQVVLLTLLWFLSSSLFINQSIQIFLGILLKPMRTILPFQHHIYLRIVASILSPWLLIRRHTFTSWFQWFDTSLIDKSSSCFKRSRQATHVCNIFSNNIKTLAWSRLV